MSSKSDARSPVRSRHTMSWALHVAVDIALAFGLLLAGVHEGGGDSLVLDAAGGYLLLATLVTSGPGRLRLLPRLAHRVLDGVVSLGLFVSPLIVSRAHVHIGLFPTVMAEAVAVIVLRDALVSDHRPRSRSPRRGSGPGGAIETTAVERTPGAAARRLGVAAGRARRRSGAVDLDGAARRAGTLAGRAKRAASAGRGVADGAGGVGSGQAG